MGCLVRAFNPWPYGGPFNIWSSVHVHICSLATSVCWTFVRIFGSLGISRGPAKDLKGCKGSLRLLRLSKVIRSDLRFGVGAINGNRPVFWMATTSCQTGMGLGVCVCVSFFQIALAWSSTGIYLRKHCDRSGTDPPVFLSLSLGKTERKAAPPFAGRCWS